MTSGCSLFFFFFFPYYGGISRSPSVCFDASLMLCGRVKAPIQLYAAIIYYIYIYIYVQNRNRKSVNKTTMGVCLRIL